MASDDAIAELATSLSAEDVPVKLRCATCSLIAYNALRLPCCEQNICEPCYKELEDVCQVCHHEPLDKSLCTANKSLRTTTKVFLKKKLLERANEAKKREAAAVTTIPVTTQETAATDSGKSAGETAAAPVSSDTRSPLSQAGGKPEPAPSQVEATKTSANLSRETPSTDHHDVAHDGELTREEAPLQNGGGEHGKEWLGDGSGMQANQAQANESNNLGGFPTDMATMMAMGAMPNMLGMGMDPMMMNAMTSTMFGGFGGPNMGMNGMSGMNMGMGQGQFGGPWMMNQDSYNANAQGNGNFDNQAGYNMLTHQGNFSQMNHPQYHRNDFHNHNGYGHAGYQQFRGGYRGRRGGFYGGPQGRYNQGYMSQSRDQGNYGYTGSASSHHQDQSQQHSDTDGKVHSQQHGSAAGDRPDDMMNGQGPSTEKQDGREIQPDINHENDSVAPVTGKDGEDTDMTLKPTNGLQGSGNAADEQPLPIQTFISDEPRSRNSMPMMGNNFFNGPSGQFAQTGRQSFGAPPSIESPRPGPQSAPRVVGVPGAPTGPRALREGFKNSSRSGPVPHRPFSPVVSAPRPHESNRSSNLHHEIPRSTSPSRAQSESRERSASRDRTVQNDIRDEKTLSPASSDRYAENRNAQNDERDNENYHENQHADEGNESGVRRNSHRSTRRHDSHREESSHQRHERRPKRTSSKDRRRTSERESEYVDKYEKDYEKERSPGPRESESSGKRRNRSRSPSSSSAHRAVHHDEAGHDRSSRKRRSRDESRDDTERHERHRDRDRDRDRDREKDRDRDRDRDGHERRYRKRSRRDRSRSRSAGGHRHASSSHADSKPTTPATPVFPGSLHPELSAGIDPSRRGSASASIRAIPSGPKAHSERRRGGEPHRSSRHGSRSETLRGDRDDGGSTASPVFDKDPHTLEREARDRERLMKEMQRRAVADESRGGEGTEGRRKSSVKYEDGNRESGRRGERERARHR